MSGVDIEGCRMGNLGCNYGKRWAKINEYRERE